MSAQDELLKDLRRLGKARDRARDRAFGLTKEMAPLVIRAHELDTPVTHIAAASGLSRDAIYTILRQGSPPPER